MPGLDMRRGVLVASIILTLLLLPSIPGCGCGEDSGNPTSLRGGCRVCVAFRVLEEDFNRVTELTDGSPSTESGGGGNPTLDLKLCIQSEDATLGGVGFAPPCVEDLEVGDVAEWEIILGSENPTGTACFTVCECLDDSPVYEFCIEWFDCETYRIFDPLMLTASTPDVSEPVRVYECDEIPELCCFCVRVYCPPPVQPPTSTLVDDDGSIESSDLKKIRFYASQFDPSLADPSTGFQPIIKPDCAFAQEGGFAQFEVCVLADHNPNAEMILQAEEGTGESIGSATVFFGQPGLCDVAMDNGSPLLALDRDCEPYDPNLCCYPVTVCLSLPDFGLNPSSVWGKVNASSFPGTEIWPNDPKNARRVSTNGGNATFFVCVPFAPGDGSVVVSFCSDQDFLGQGGGAPFIVGSAELFYDVGVPCIPRGIQVLNGSVGLGYDCPPSDPD